jgi:hypothetical protein
MRKFIAIIMIMVMALGLCACGNENWGFGNYNWKHVHFSDAVSGHCATISSWHDNTAGIEIHTVECGSMFLSEGSYILFESGSDCPFCGD